MAKSNRKSRNSLTPLVVIILCLIVYLVYHHGGTLLEKLHLTDFEWTDSGESVVLSDGDKSETTQPFVLSDDALAVHFIDVGQGSATLIQDGKNGILIDAGEAEYADTVISYLKKCGVKTLKYVIATHPHSDHIGAMAKVLNTFGADNILIPKLSKANTPATSCYRNLLTAVKNNGINGIYATPGATYSFGKHVKFTVLGPVVQDENLNNMSIVTSMTIDGTRLLFPGDAETAELKTILGNGADVSCDVMLMAHHGSAKTSYYTPYLNAAAPKYAVISCGKNNDYGHPHREILSYLKDNQIEYHRTDTEGSIVLRVNDSGCAFDRQ